MRFRMASGDFGRGLGLLLARWCLAGIFLYAGYKNIGRIDETAVTLAAKGYPAPKVLAIVAALAALGGGASLVLGMFTRMGCVALICFLIPTTWTFHAKQALGGDPGQAIEALQNLGLIGGLLALIGIGPGGWSLDRRLFGRRFYTDP